MTLWGGRFDSAPADAMAALSRSVHFDWRLAPYEIEVNRIHLKNLVDQGVVSKENGKKIESALLDLAKDIGSGSFKYTDADEDVHSAIERGLTERCGELGGAIRAGRSRNDLVVTDFKLYLIDHLLEIASQISAMVKVINTQAANNLDVIAPGFTHTQHAQPITFAQELSKHSHALLRDIDRIFDWLKRNSFSPFGAGALAGSSIQPNPEKVAKDLGFSGAMANSIDAVGDRDFVAEALFDLAMLGVHLSKIGEEFVLWSSTEFGWVKIADAYSTGSSIMPQKKNADIAELARGKSGRFIGNLTSLLVVLKGLPFAYNRDLQEDKEPVFDSIDQLLILLPAITGMIETAQFNSAAISKGAADGFSLATEIADFLAKKQIPFATAHEVAGECVKFCEKNGIELDQLSDAQLIAIHPALTGEVKVFLNVQGAVASRTSSMGTSQKSVTAALSQLKKEISAVDEVIANQRKRLSGMI
ncbi:MAG: argininosuccinate lyase [Actinobacteria bacterium]|nr:argininosuccinate lyase [Actinomycetota bacterium]